MSSQVNENFEFGDQSLSLRFITSFLQHLHGNCSRRFPFIESNGLCLNYSSKCSLTKDLAKLESLPRKLPSRVVWKHGCLFIEWNIRVEHAHLIMIQEIVCNKLHLVFLSPVFSHFPSNDECHDDEDASNYHDDRC